MRGAHPSVNPAEYFQECDPLQGADSMSAMLAIPIPDQTPSPQTYTARAYAAQSPTSGMGAISIPRRTSQPKDVQIEILYCGICHSDVHFMRNEFANIMPSTYPCIPGHEI